MQQGLRMAYNFLVDLRAETTKDDSAKDDDLVLHLINQIDSDEARSYFVQHNYAGGYLPLKKDWHE